VLTDGVFEGPDDHRQKTQKRARRMQSSEAGQFTPHEPTTKRKKRFGEPPRFFQSHRCDNVPIIIIIIIIIIRYCSLSILQVWFP